MGVNRPALRAVILLGHAAPILADTPVPAAPAPEITVTAPRGLTVGGIAPLLELSPSQLESYGADSLSDLVDALNLLFAQQPKRWRARGAHQRAPGGHYGIRGPAERCRRAGRSAARNRRPAIRVLEKSAGNIVLREHYRAVLTRLSEGAATEGSDRNSQVDASLVRLSSDARVTVLGSYSNIAKLLESDGGIE
jgi:iron complex outermembrane receptor protein